MLKRIKWLDFAKGVTIFFVVMAHSLSTVYDTRNINSAFFIPLTSIIFTFIMPCFFAISGYLYKPIKNIRSYKNMIYKKIISLGIPYLLFSVFYVFIQNFGGDSRNHPLGYQSLLKIYSNPISYLWFIYALFFMFIIVGLLDLIHLNNKLQLLIYLLCTVISFTSANVLYSGLQYTFNNILFFYIGYMISRNMYKTYLNKIIKDKKVTILLLIVFILLLIFQSFYITGSSTNITNVGDIFTKIISIFLLINLSNVLPNSKIYNYFTRYGKLTLIIYLVHAPTVSTLRAVGFKLIEINNITSIILSLLLFIFVWLISVLICYLSYKFNFIYCMFYPLNKIFKKVK